MATQGGGVSGGDGNDNITGSNENRFEEFLDGNDDNDIINSRNVGLRDTSVGFASATRGACGRYRRRAA